ncbi:MAG: CPBP family glutamic-type intramembrane protease [Acidobacteria bacterium]|nr:CPBP family glutamic-type intramembrane protease [Acidobacteriota bacterium]
MTLQELGLDFLQETPEIVEKTVAELSPIELTWKPSDMEFSALEHVCHLLDIEREGYQERIRRLLEEDAPYLPDLDGQRLALERKYNEQELEIALEEFARIRQENVETILCLGPEQLDRGGTLEGIGWITLGQLLGLMREHDELHREELRILRERIIKERNPFLKIRARGLLLWFLYGFILFAIGLVVNDEALHFDEYTITNIYSIFFYGWILLGIYRKINQGGIDISLFLQKTWNTRWYQLVGLVLCLIIFALGSIYLFCYLFTYAWPGIFESELMKRDDLYDPNHPIYNKALDILIVVVIAPIIEEIMFRGILLNRWISKWGMRKSILVTSLIFALLHFDVLGAFLFAICMAILYFRTRTLLIPIAAHALNNMIAVTLGFWWPDNSDGSASSLIDAYRSAVWFGVGCFALSLPILILYINRNWPKKDAVSPYVLQMKERSA